MLGLHSVSGDTVEGCTVLGRFEGVGVSDCPFSLLGLGLLSILNRLIDL